MILDDAIRSGRLFKRQGSTKWIKLVESGGIYCIYADDGTEMPFFTVEEVLAEDYEIQEPVITITKTQFWTAACEIPYGGKGNAAFFHLAKKLGLEE